jgi:two-component sensor histidine kinase
MEWGGRKMWFHNYRYPIKNEAGEVIEVASFCRNITALKDTEHRLIESLREKDILVKEVHHRVKNNLQMIDSLLSLQEKKISDAEAKVLFLESKNRIKSIAMIHEKLYGNRNMAEIDCSDFLGSLTASILSSYSLTPGIVTLITDIKGVVLGIDKAIPYSLLVNELVSNSIKYAYGPGEKGTITVSSYYQDGNYYLSVRDDGSGMPEGFDFNNTATFGMQLVRILVEQLDGNVELRTSAEGSEFIIVFPE